VHEFAGGERIEVRWTEWVNHDSYYRVAFDVDGDDDFPVRPGPAVPRRGDDPTRVFPVDGKNILAYDLNDGAGGEHVLEVTLPNVDCDRCTLQLIQYMYDTERVYYFQCADLRLTASAAAGPVLDAALDFGTLLPPREAPPAAPDAGAGASAAPDAGPPEPPSRPSSDAACSVPRGAPDGPPPWAIMVCISALCRRRRRRPAPAETLCRPGW
jgi:hypothetical protein